MPDVEDSADVRACHLASQLDLPFKPVGCLGNRCNFGADELKRHALTEVESLRFVDFSPASASDRLDDPVALGENLVRRQRRGSIPIHGRRVMFSGVTCFRRFSPSRRPQEFTCPIMLGKQALHFAAKRHIPSTGFRQELESTLWRLFHGGVKYSLDSLPLIRGHSFSLSGRVRLAGHARGMVH